MSSKDSTGDHTLPLGSRREGSIPDAFKETVVQSHHPGAEADRIAFGRTVSQNSSSPQGFAPPPSGAVLPVGIKPSSDEGSPAPSRAERPGGGRDPKLAQTLAGPAALHAEKQDEAVIALQQTLADAPPQIARGSASDLDLELRRSLGGRTASLPSVKSLPGQGASQAELYYEERRRYQPLDALGEGGMGEVLLVQDNDINRKVAMKRLHAHAEQTQSVLRFVEEVRTVGGLEHPNIVPIHDVGLDEEGHYYFIMKHFDGETLEEIIEKLKAGDRTYHERFSFAERVNIFMEVLQAIRFAHARGIIHRDIKPANIMVGQNGEVMVMDWGLAKQIHEPGEAATVPDEQMSEHQESEAIEQLARTMMHGDGSIEEQLKLTADGELLGTPAYMSPEQARGQIDRIDERSDIYALAVTFYELMTLTHYLEDKTDMLSVLFGVCKETPRFPGLLTHERQPPVPAEFAHFVMRGMEKEPDERYASLDQMYYTLKMAREGKFEVQCPVTFSKRGTHIVLDQLDRHPYLVSIGVLAMPLLFLTTLILLIATNVG